MLQLWTLRYAQGPVQGGALTSSPGLTSVMPTLHLLKHSAPVLLATVIPVSQPHTHLPLWTRGLRQEEREYRERKYLKPDLRTTARGSSICACSLPPLSPHTPSPVCDSLIIFKICPLPILPTYGREETGGITNLFTIFALW